MPSFRVWLLVGSSKDSVRVDASDAESAKDEALKLRPAARVVHVAPEGE